MKRTVFALAQRLATVRVRSWIVCAGICLLTACTTTSEPWSIQSQPNDAYRQLNPAQVTELRLGIEWLEQERWTAARSAFASLVTAAPLDLAAAVWLQEARIATAQRSVATNTGSGTPQQVLRDGYRRLAEREETPLALYLAARLEEDPLSAQLLLQRALELDPNMSWAHYALAHVAARMGDWLTAHNELARTFELVPGHLQALRLHGWFQAEAGATAEAIEALEAWLLNSEADWLATEQMRNEVRLDLALAYSADGQEGRASKLLRELEPGAVNEVRRLTALAVVEQGQDNLEAARDAVLLARAADPTAILPVVQDAMLLELWLGNAPAAREAWEQVIALTEESDDLGASLQRFRAQVHLERMVRASEPRTSAP